MRKRRRGLAISAAILSTVGASSAHAIVSTGVGIDIGTFIGANTFYSNSYTGSRSVIANIEAGVAWNGHETLKQGQVALYFADPSISNQAGWTASTNAWTDRHATWVGQTLVGEGSLAYQRGIAYGATLWSGAIAYSSTGNNWNSAGAGNWSSSFNISGASFTTPYYDAMVAGVSGQGTADVINSSWGSGSGSESGNDYLSQTIDALMYTSGAGSLSAAKVVCLSAGNAGSGTNTIEAPAACFNAIVVGATGPDTANYGTISTFSSRSPTSVYNPGSNTTISFARNRVDLVAPGEELKLALYSGATGGNVFGGASNLNAATYSTEAGTSFSSPITAASAALVVDAGKARFASDPKAIDARVIKAVLMNSATKLTGWNNGQTTSNGVITTTTSLDPTQGAGELNLTQAYPQYTTGTTDVAGLGGGTVHTIGWDYGSVAANGHNDYTMDSTLLGGAKFTITLDWFAHETLNVAAETTSYAAFDNLDLEVLEVINGVPTLVAQSDSKYNSSEHLYFSVPSTGSYVFRVLDAGFNWNGIGGVASDTSTDYGIAWSAVPEPNSLAMLVPTFGILLRRGRRLKSEARNRKWDR